MSPYQYLTTFSGPSPRVLRWIIVAIWVLSLISNALLVSRHDDEVLRVLMRIHGSIDHVFMLALIAITYLREISRAMKGSYALRMNYSSMRAAMLAENDRNAAVHKGKV